MRQVRHQGTDHARVVEAFKALRAHVASTPREPQDVADFSTAKSRADFVGDCAEQLERKEREGELDPVRKLNSHHVAAPDALRLKKGGSAIYPVLQLPICYASPGIDDGFAVGVLGNARTEESINGLRAPPAASYVAVDHPRREPGLECHCADLIRFSGLDCCLAGISACDLCVAIKAWIVDVIQAELAGPRLAHAASVPTSAQRRSDRSRRAYPSPADLSFQ